MTVTALRETEEELGIPRNQVKILGRLDDFYSIHGYHVIPYIGVIPSPDDLQHDPFEIAGTFEAPLDYFRNPAIHRTRTGGTADALIWWISTSSKNMSSGV